MKIFSQKNVLLLIIIITLTLSSCTSPEAECTPPTAILNYSGDSQIPFGDSILVSDSSSRTSSMVSEWEVTGGEIIEESGTIIKVQPHAEESTVGITLLVTDCEVESDDASIMISIFPIPTSTPIPTSSPLPTQTSTHAIESSATFTPSPIPTYTSTATGTATSTATSVSTPTVTNTPTPEQQAIIEPETPIFTYSTPNLLPVSIIGDKIMMSWTGVPGGLPEGYFYAVRVGPAGEYEESQTWTRETHFELTYGNEFFPGNQEYSWHVAVVYDWEGDGDGRNGGWDEVSERPPSQIFYVNVPGPGGPPPTNTPIGG